jgi:hypothetical protein
MAELMRPLWRWSITLGLQRLDMDADDTPPCNDSSQLLEVMHDDSHRGIWLLFDFPPYLRYAMNLRRLREIVLGQAAARHSVVLIGAKIELPEDLEALATRFTARLPDEARLATRCCVKRPSPTRASIVRSAGRDRCRRAETGTPASCGV